MSNEVDAKIETIIISVINRLYKMEETCGMNEDDLKCFEIICKIKRDYNPGAAAEDPTKGMDITAESVMELMRKAKRKPNE